MVCNDQVLFLHAPKTAGMSITHFLRTHLPGPVYVTAPQGHEDSDDGVKIVPGIRHEWLHKAEETLAPLGRNLASFKRIISVLRNPYDLEVSRFFYLRLGHPYDKGYAQAIALSGDFEEFSEKAPYIGNNPSNIEAWYVMDGRLLPNLRLIRFEALESGLRSALSGFINHELELPKINQTKHETFEKYLTPRAEVGIYKKYSWLFDYGFYPRHPIAVL